MSEKYEFLRKKRYFFIIYAARYPKENSSICLVSKKYVVIVSCQLIFGFISIKNRREIPSLCMK